MKKEYSSMQEIKEKFFPNFLREKSIQSENYEKIGKIFSEETLEKVREELKVK